MAPSTSLAITPSSSCNTKSSPEAANISRREYIYFLPHPLPPGTPVPYTPGLPLRNPLALPTTCFEPTSTLVLTSPNNTFVDLRLLKPQHADCESALPNKAEAARLEWAFAGSSTSVGVWKEGCAGVNHSVWTHWLDSRYPVGDVIPLDQGDMYPISETLTLEVGHAYHPALRAVKGHEELWRDVPVLATPVAPPPSTTPMPNCKPDKNPSTNGTTSNTGSDTTTTDDNSPSQKKISITLRLDDPGAALRGLVVRVGQYAQGILIKGNAVTAERWEYNDPPVSTLPQNQYQHQHQHHNQPDAAETGAPLDAPGGWQRTARIGDLFLPCPVTFRPEVLEVGARVRYGQFEWGVEEVWEWV